MRRTGRHKFIRLSVFFLVYSVIHVLSVERNSGNAEDISMDKTPPEPLEPSASKGVAADEPKGGINEVTNQASDHGSPGEPSKIVPQGPEQKGEQKPKGDNKKPAALSKEEEQQLLLGLLLLSEAEAGKENGQKPKGETGKLLVPSKGEGKVQNAKGETGNGNEKGGDHEPGKGNTQKPKGENEKPPVPSNGEEKKQKTKGETGNGNEKGGKGNKQKPGGNNEKAAVPSKGDNNNKAGVQEPGKAGNKDIPHDKQERNETMKNETEKCIPAAIRQFPRPLMSQRVRSHGGLILHIIVAVYMFIGLALVCDEYFVASLDRICEEMKMAPDVAGATFMAAGSSAPELATVIIGVFYAEDDIGISGVIGSAMFNIMFVISVCALATETVVYLNWWPLIRDSAFYALSIFIMLLVLLGPDVNWIESLIMLIAYVVYCVVLHYNPALERWSQTLPVPFKTFSPNEQSGLVSYKKLAEGGKHTTYGMDQNSVEQQPQQQPQQQQQDFNQWSPGNEWSPEKSSGQTFHQEPISGPALNQATTDIPPPQPPVRGPIQQDYYKPKEYDPSTKVNPLVKPADDAGTWAKFKWAVLFPIHFFCIYTMPDCRSEKYKNWYPFTFFVSMLWISFYSYFMVWMITIIGYTLGIPDTVMGLTFVAAGVSVPDALSSIAVIKEGYGDMAVSNAIGSNVFDILICLGLPWFLKTAVIQPGSYVTVTSKGLTYSTLSLLSTVAFLIAAVHFNGWKLDRKLGIILMVWYLLFIIFASLYELNVFGYMNPVDCLTDY